MRCSCLSAAFVAVFGMAALAVADTRYVATNGSDSNPGTEAQPWRTISKAAATAVAGDTVYVKAGTFNERVIFRNSGSAGAYITFMPYPGHAVTIDGSGLSVPEWSGLLQIIGKRHIKISGFRIANSAWAGLYVARDDYAGIRASNIVVERNRFYNTLSSAILVSAADDFVIDGNDVELGSNAPSDVWVQEIVSIQYYCNRFEIRNNYVHNGGRPYGGGEGIIVKYGSSNGKVYDNAVDDVASVGIYVDAWSAFQSDVEVFGNRVHRASSGISLSAEDGGTLERVRVYNNVVSGCRYSGTLIPAYGTGTVRNCSVINNTYYGNSQGAIDVGQWTGPVDAVTLRNNICSQNALFQIHINNRSGISNIAVDHNLIDGFRGYGGEVRGSDYVEGSPQFVDASGRDFHVAGSSPAIDRGSSLSAPATDFDGGLRPAGAGIDIGAFEFGAAAGGGGGDAGATPPDSRSGRCGATGAEPLIIVGLLCLISRIRTARP